MISEAEKHLLTGCSCLFQSTTGKNTGFQKSRIVTLMWCFITSYLNFKKIHDQQMLSREARPVTLKNCHTAVGDETTALSLQPRTP